MIALCNNVNTIISNQYTSRRTCNLIGRARFRARRTKKLNFLPRLSFVALHICGNAYVSESGNETTIIHIGPTGYQGAGVESVCFYFRRATNAEQRFGWHERRRMGSKFDHRAILDARSEGGCCNLD